MQAVSKKAITYIDEFKRHFITENEKGRLPRDIFEQAGLDIEINRYKTNRIFRKTLAYRKAGVEGLQNTRKMSSGRPSDCELTLEEKIGAIRGEK